MSPQDEAEFRSNDASLQRLEAELAALAPRALKLDRDRAMYLAGQASAGLATARPSGRSRAWPTAFSAMTALAASLLVVIALRPSVQIVEKIVQVPVQAVPQPGMIGPTKERHTAELDETHLATAPQAAAERDRSAGTGSIEADYLSLRDRVLAMGVDTWQPQARPTEQQSHSQPASYHDLLNSLLREG